MYKIDQIKSMFDCKFCSKLLVDPVTIPCGNTVCQSHLKEFTGKKTHQCLCCNKQHLVQNEGFVISEFIQKQLSMQLNSIDINSVYEKCKTEIEEAKKNLTEIEELNKDSENYIYNYFEEIKRKVDLRREVLKDEIDKYSNEVTQNINETQANYIKLSKETTQLKINIENSKKELNELINQFDTLKIDEKKFHDIKVKVVAVKLVIEEDLVKLKNSLIGNKEYSFVHSDQPITDIFGIFDIFETMSTSIQHIKKKLLKLCGFSQEQKLNLIYRATTNGFDAKDFHSKCDGKKNTLTIIKTTNGNIFGGYTDQAWDSTNQYYPDQNAFIFSFVNKNSKPFKAEVNQNSLNAIYCASSYGPIFGGGHDFFISSNSNTNQNSFSDFGHTYKHPDYKSDSIEAKSILAGSFKFQTVEIEVFIVD